MRDVLTIVQSDIDEMLRLAAHILTQLTSSDSSASPIRYRTVLEQAIRIRTLWASHMQLSEQVYSFISIRDPRFGNSLNHFTVEQQHLARELKLLTPALWPRSSDLGLNSLRIRAFHTLPRLTQELEREKLTLIPLLRRWVYGDAIAKAAGEQKGENVIRETASAHRR